MQELKNALQSIYLVETVKMGFSIDGEEEREWKNTEIYVVRP